MEHMQENLQHYRKEVNKEDTSQYVEIMMKSQSKSQKKVKQIDSTERKSKGFVMSKEPRFNNLSFTEKIDNFMNINRIQKQKTVLETDRKNSSPHRNHIQNNIKQIRNRTQSPLVRGQSSNQIYDSNNYVSLSNESSLRNRKSRSPDNTMSLSKMRNSAESPLDRKKKLLKDFQMNFS